MKYCTLFFCVFCIFNVFKFELSYSQFLGRSLFKTRKLGPPLMEATFYIYGPPEQNITGSAFVLGRLTSIDSASIKPDSIYFKSYNQMLQTFNGQYFRVLITAAHILKDIKGDYAFLWLRKKNGDDYEAFEHRIKIRDNGIPLWTSSANNLDFAVMYVDLPNDIPSIILSHTYLSKSEGLDDIELNAGEDLLCLGFPHNTFSNAVGFPILRSGKFASYRNKHTQKENNFLFDFQVYQGNSGGPVFVDLRTFLNINGEERIALPAIIGLVSDQLKSTEGNPIEVAKVVPAEFIYDAIERLPLPINSNLKTGSK